MLKSIIVLSLFGVIVVWGSCGPQDTINNEGKVLCCYYDTKNIPTIGIGFNLKRSDASSVMLRYNLTLKNVLKDCQSNTKKNCLTNAQADDIFNQITYPEAAACVDTFVPNLPTQKRAALIDVAFAGCKTLNKFSKMKAALQKKDWQKAGDQLRTSKWCADVKATRCNADYNCIIDDSCTGGTCGTFVPGCLSSSNCYCFKMSNGTGFCSQDYYCNQYPGCSSCPSSTSVCLIDTCCGKPMCVPLSLGTACKKSSKNLLSNLFNQPVSKQPKEKSAAHP